MPIKFYNTLSRKKEKFVPIIPGQVRMYTCGPTVYNSAHIGNFRTFMFEDLLKRYLQFKGFRVTHVMNLTDVDDKTIRRSREEGVTIDELTGRYTDLFHQDLKTLKIIPADHYPRATTHVTEMIELIGKLIEKGHAYRTEDGSVFFAIGSYAEYGQLARLVFSEQQSSERVEADDYSKENPQDFTLWKAWKPEDGEVAWDSPWGRGRPGWHIECSAMSTKYLGNHFDIHCGGVDNLFPHHENEIAQSQCATGEKFVNFWMHSEHLLLGSDKMSKSLGNFYRIDELLDAGFTAGSLRFILLSTHYRSKLKFTLEKHHEAQKAIRRIQELSGRLNDFIRGRDYIFIKPSLAVFETFEAALDDDLDVSGALGVFFEWIRTTNTMLDDNQLNIDQAIESLNFIREVDSILAVLTEAEAVVPAEIQVIVDQRETARKDRDWKQSDDLRNLLRQRGWIIEDSPQGPKVRPAD
ncbi:MAG: cysteine--tRNA ligase [Candidatus Neomarinimicrobiota bacterium]